MYDGKITLFVDGGKQHGDAKAVGEGQQFFFAVARMHAVHARCKVLLDDMAAVAGRNDHDVADVSLHAALQSCLERGDAVVVLAQGKVVDKDDELHRHVRELGFQHGQGQNIFLVDLHKAQLFVCIQIDHRVHGGGFPRPAVAIQQHIRIWKSRDKTFKVVAHFLFFALIALEVIKRDVGERTDGDKLPARKAEGPVRKKSAVPVLRIIGRQPRERSVVPVARRKGRRSDAEGVILDAKRAGDLCKICGKRAAQIIGNGLPCGAGAGKGVLVRENGACYVGGKVLLRSAFIEQMQKVGSASPFIQIGKCRDEGIGQNIQHGEFMQCIHGIAPIFLEISTLS